MAPKAEELGLVSAYRINRNGKAKALNWKSIGTKATGNSWSWLHFDADDQPTKDWFEAADDLDNSIAEALVSSGTRPRFEATADGFLLILRGVNLNPGQEPSDMISIRFYMDKNRIITTRRERVQAIFAMRELYDGADTAGPATPADFVIALANGLVARIATVIDEVETEVADVEDATIDDFSTEKRDRILKLRSHTISLSRYIAPQQRALEDLLASQSEMFSEEQRSALRLAIDSTARHVESLDAVRDRAVAVHEHVATSITDRMNLTMYRLAVVTMIFLPLMFLTGLLGINVGGMPGMESSAAFWVVVSLLVILGVGGVWLMRKWKMI